MVCWLRENISRETHSRSAEGKFYYILQNIFRVWYAHEYTVPQLVHYKHYFIHRSRWRSLFCSTMRNVYTMCGGCATMLSSRRHNSQSIFIGTHARNQSNKDIKRQSLKKNRHCLYSVAVHWLTIAFTDCKHYHVTMSHKYKYDATYTLTFNTSTNKINVTNHKTHGERALRTELYIQYYPYKLNWLTNWIRWTDTTDCPESSVSSIRVSYEYDSI